MKFPTSTIGARWALLSERPWLFTTWKKFGAVMLSLLLIPSGMILFIATFNAQRRVEKQSFRELDMWGQLFSRQITEEFFGLERYVESFATRSSFIRAAESNDIEEAKRQLRAMAENNQEISRAALVDRHGALVAAFPNDSAVIRQDFSRQEWFKTSMNSSGAHVTETHHTATLNGEDVVTIGCALRSPDGQIVGCIGTQYFLADLRTWLRRQLEKTPLDIVLVNHSGNVIYDHCGIFEEKLLQIQAPAHSYFTPHQKDEKQLVSSFELPDMQWRLFVLMPRGLAMEPVREIRLIILGFSALWLLLFFSIGAIWIQTLLRYARGLERGNKHLEYVCYSIAHNFRAPLRAIAGFSEFLREKVPPADAEAGDYISRISSSAASLDGLVNDLLAFGAVSRADLKLETLALAPIVKAAAADLKEEVDARRAEIQIEDDLPPVLGDRGLLRLVFKEVLSNSIKFIPKDRTPKLSVEARAQNRCVQVIVKDNGIGIQKAHQQEIFEIFHKLEANTPGTGVGLAIVRNAIDRMGGSVSVESTVNVGSSFLVTLPKP